MPAHPRRARMVYLQNHQPATNLVQMCDSGKHDEAPAIKAIACVIGLMVLSLLLNEALRLGSNRSPSLENWMRYHSILAQGFLMLLRPGLWLLVAFAFSGCQSFRSFAHASGLDSRISQVGLLLTPIAIGIAIFDLSAGKHEWTSSNRETLTFYSRGALPWSFFLANSVAIVPFYEEVVIRGFAYHTLRRSYGMLLSITVVLCVQTFFHWGTVSRSVIALISLFLLWILLCCIRERTDSVWNCVLAHSCYNAAVMREWLICFAALVLGLLALRSRRTSKSEHFTKDAGC